MTNVRSYTSDQILSRVESLPSFQGWLKGKYEIWVRSNEDEFNKFDDKVYSFECKVQWRRPDFKMVHTGTTNAGAEGLKNFEKYGNKRCAILASDLLIYNSHKRGLHKGDYEAYRQDKPWPYHEDTNKDEKSDETSPLVEGKVIGANMHRAGRASVEIGGWSIACLVRNIRSQYDEWMEYMKGDMYCHGCILKEWEA